MLGAFASKLVLVVIKILKISTMEERVPHIVAFHIILISMVATVLSIVWNWGGLCVDMLGLVESTKRIQDPFFVYYYWVFFSCFIELYHQLRYGESILLVGRC